MFHFLCPRQVRDMDQSVNTFFDLNEHTKVSKVTNFSCVFRSYRIFFLQCFPMDLVSTA